MAFKQLPDLDCSETIALGGVNKNGEKNQTTITGYYIGSRIVDGKKGPAQLHVFQTKDGNVGVWGKTNLNHKLAAAVPGALTRVTFVGMVETKNNPMYKYKVEIDRNDNIDVSTVNAGLEQDDSEDAEPSSFTSGSSNHSYQDDGEPEEASLDDEEEALDEVKPTRAAPPKAAAKTPDAARQAKVRALLAGSKRSP